MARRGGLTDSGFLIVKRFEAIYVQFAADERWDRDIYALPLHATGPDRRAIHYHGLDREALWAWPAHQRSDAQVPSLAEIRLGEIIVDDPAHADRSLEDDSFVTDQQDAQDILEYAD